MIISSALKLAIDHWIDNVWLNVSVFNEGTLVKIPPIHTPDRHVKVQLVASLKENFLELKKKFIIENVKKKGKFLTWRDIKPPTPPSYAAFNEFIYYIRRLDPTFFGRSYCRYDEARTFFFCQIRWRPLQVPLSPFFFYLTPSHSFFMCCQLFRRC